MLASPYWAAYWSILACHMPKAHPNHGQQKQSFQRRFAREPKRRHKNRVASVLGPAPQSVVARSIRSCRLALSALQQLEPSVVVVDVVGVYVVSTQSSASSVSTHSHSLRSQPTWSASATTYSAPCTSSHGSSRAPRWSWWWATAAGAVVAVAERFPRAAQAAVGEQ